MTIPDAYRLEGKTLRALLAGLGCREVYALLPGEPVSPAEGLSGIAALASQQVVQNDGTRLTLEEPLHTWLLAMVRCPRMVRLRVPESPWPDLCLYPMEGSPDCLCCMAPAERGTLRLGTLPTDRIWEELCQICPTLDLPTPPEDATLTPVGNQARGEQFRLQLYLSGEGGLRREAVAVWGPGYYTIEEEGMGVPYSRTLMQDTVEDWLVRGL